MSQTKDKLRAHQPVFGGSTMTGGATVVRIMAEAGFDFISVDL